MDQSSPKMTEESLQRHRDSVSTLGFTTSSGKSGTLHSMEVRNPPSSGMGVETTAAAAADMKSLKVGHFFTEMYTENGFVCDGQGYSCKC